MAYTKQTWINNKTKLNADNLNNIEHGIEHATTTAEAAAAQASANLETINGHSIAINTTINNKIVALTQTVTNNHNAINSRVDSAESRVLTAENNINTLYGQLSESGQLSETLTTQINNHTTDRSNPHFVTAEQVDAYSKSEMNTILDPVCAISETGVSNIGSFSCSNISSHKHYLKLELYNCVSSIFGSNCLWNIEAVGTNYTLNNSQSLNDILDSCNATLGSLTSEFFYEPDAAERTEICFSALNPDILSTGLVIDTSDFSENRESILIYLALYNSNLKKVYILGLGNPQCSANDFNCVIENNKLYCAKIADGGASEIIDLPKDTAITAIGIKQETTSYNIKIKQANLAKTSFTLHDENDQPLVSMPFYTNGTYFIPYEGTATSTDIFGNLHFANNITASYQLSYLRNDSSLARLTQLVPECEMTADTISSEVQKNLQFFITSGTADPDINTPGQFYFKYLS